MRPTVTELLPGILAVPVPDEIKNAHFYRVNNESIMLKWDDVNHPLNIYDVVRVDKHYGDLEDYKWPEILFTTKDLKEEDTVGVVDGHFDTELQEWRYGFKANNSMIYESAVDALQSLLRSHNLTGKNYLLIKRQP